MHPCKTCCFPNSNSRRLLQIPFWRFPPNIPDFLQNTWIVFPSGVYHSHSTTALVKDLCAVTSLHSILALWLAAFFQAVPCWRRRRFTLALGRLVTGCGFSWNWQTTVLFCTQTPAWVTARFFSSRPYRLFRDTRRVVESAVWNVGHEFSFLWRWPLGVGSQSPPGGKTPHAHFRTKWPFHYGWGWTFQTTNDANHLLLCWRPSTHLLFWSGYTVLVVTFKNAFSSNDCVVRVLYIFWPQVLSRIYALQILSPNLCLAFSISFYSIHGVFQQAKLPILIKFSFQKFFLWCVCVCVPLRKYLPNPRSWRFSPMWFLQFLWL